MITAQDYLIKPGGSAAKPGDYTMPKLFASTVATRANEPAVFDGTRFRTWNEWAQDAHALARALQELGVAQGDVVALHLPNSWEFLTLHIATALIGAVGLTVHMAYGTHEMRVLLERTAASVLVLPATYHTRDLLTTGREFLASSPSLRHLLVVDTQKHPDIPGVAELTQQWAGFSPHEVPITPDDPFILLASSGTTSLRPKICLHTHDGLLSNAVAAALDGQARSDDTLMSASPFTHLFGLLSLHISLFTGGRQALFPTWHAQTFLDQARRSGATVTFAAPTQLRDVCAYLDAHPDAPRLTLREVRSGGAKVPASLIADVQRLLGAHVVVQWGMSEVGAGISTRPDDPPSVVSTSVGRPVRGAEVRVVAMDDSELPIGETGELCYRSPYLFRGYLHDAELTRASVTVDGWLRTGDLASCDEDGIVTYQGRRTELINRGALKFSAVEVESLLADLPQLNQYVVTSRPDPRLGERCCLIATLRPETTLTLATIVAHLAAKGLARYKWPEELLLVDELPTTPTGKIARARLAHLLQATADGEKV